MSEQAYEAYWWLMDNHSWAIENMYIMYMKVDPTTHQQEDDATRNTLVQVWLETGPMEYVKQLERRISSHDIDLDCGGDTFDEALVSLRGLVVAKYGIKGSK